jgi:hypothetical protein
VIFIPLTVVKILIYGRFERTLFRMAEQLRGPFEKFVDSQSFDSRYYSESELRGGAVTVSFSNKVSPLTFQTALVVTPS